MTYQAKLRPDHFVKTALALAAMALTLPAQAGAGTPATLVQDGGFESALGGVHAAGGSTASLGDGWVMTQGTTFVFNDTVDPGFPYSGHQGLDLTLNYTETNSISQQLDTIAGQDYTLSFYAANDTPGSLFAVQFGDSLFQPVVPANGHGQPNYSFFSLDVAATSAHTVLTFTGNNLTGPNYGLQLDDVSVAPAPVPEASSVISLSLLLLLGAGSLVATQRHKQSRAV